MIQATSSYGLHTQEQVALLAEWGFTHVVNVEVSDWAVEAERCHKEGLRLIARWPEYHRLGLLGEADGFRNHEGAWNSDGPSAWNPRVLETSVPSLDELIGCGVDGILIHLLVGDRPIPGDWWEPPRRHWGKDYWSFDRWAKAEWDGLEQGPMPEHPALGDQDNLEFYRWYQGGWARRLRDLTEQVISRGVLDVWTWFIPLLSWSIVNMAGGIAGGDKPMAEWRDYVSSLGGRPVNVIACLFPLGDERSRLDTRRLATEGWEIIAGIETCTAIAHGKRNKPRCKELGVGVFAGDEVFFRDHKGARRLFAEAAWTTPLAGSQTDTA